MKINYHITVEGSIGVGKTSLAKILAEEFQAQLILEKFEENPFLSEFYKNSKQYAFQTQLFFLLSRYKQQDEFKQTDLFNDKYPITESSPNAVFCSRFKISNAFGPSTA